MAKAKKQKDKVHRCNDPRCAGFDRERIFKRVKQYGPQFIQLLDSQPATVYSVGLFALHGVPELVIWGEGEADDPALTMILAAVAEQLKARTTILPGEAVEIGDNEKTTLYLWPSEHVTNRSVREPMAVTRDYYREVHMKRFEDVPVNLVSYRPYNGDHQHKAERWPTTDGSAITCYRVVQGLDPVVFVDHDANHSWAFLCAGKRDDHQNVDDMRMVHPEHLVESDPSLEELRDLPLDYIAIRTSKITPWRRDTAEHFFSESKE